MLLLLGAEFEPLKPKLTGGCAAAVRVERLVGRHSGTKQQKMLHIEDITFWTKPVISTTAKAADIT